MPRSKRSVIHVVPNDEGWGVKRQGAGRASSNHETKQEAVDEARRIAKQEQPSQVKIHRGDGEIQTEHTYGNDPEKYKG
jgi:hypothetical protein